LVGDKNLVMMKKKILPQQERIATMEDEKKLLNAKVETLMAVVRK